MFLQNLVAIGRTVAVLLQIIDFQHGGFPPSWIFKICKCSHSGRFRATICMFLQNILAIGRTVADLLQIIDFKYGGLPPSWIFKVCKFSHSGGFRATICMFRQNLVAIGRTNAKLLQIIDFQHGGRPPSWIRYTQAQDHPRGRIGGPKKPWKFRPNRLSSFWDMANFLFWSFSWEVPTHAQILELFREYDPLKVVSYHLNPQKAYPWPERRCLTCRS